MFQANYLDPSHSKTLHNKRSHCLSTLKPTSKLKLQLSKKKKKAILTINNEKMIIEVKLTGSFAHSGNWNSAGLLWTGSLDFSLIWLIIFIAEDTSKKTCPATRDRTQSCIDDLEASSTITDCDDLLAHVSVCVLFLRGRMCSHDLAAVVCFLISVWHNRADAQVSDRPHATPPRTQMDRLFIYLLPLTPSVEHQG